jgi:uncharacterized membrane protein HdeD (DUF308 family)
MNTGNDMTPPASQKKSQTSPPVPSAGKGVAKLLGGVAIVGLNVTLFGPSAVYFCFWIAGVAMFIGGIAEIIASFSQSASPPSQPPETTRQSSGRT